MNYLVYLFYPLLLGLLFFQSKLFKDGEWNEEVLSLRQTKALQGFAAVCIIFHHMAQKTCAPWMPSQYIVHGLDIFVPIGYLFVAIFFFYSGFGLLKSYKTKENYLKGFLPKRISPLFIATVLIGFIFMIARTWMNEAVFFPSITVGEPRQLNPNGWFPVTISVFYIGFYLAYRFCKNKKAALVLSCAVVGLYCFYCDYMIFGTWWYNSTSAFCAGLIFAEHEESFIARLKKHFIPDLIILTILNIVFIYFSVQTRFEFNRFIVLFAQLLSSVTFVLELLMLGMKISIGNKALAFLGSMTLEVYLIHGLFVHLFGYCFINEHIDSLYYIENVALYCVVVLVLSIPLAFLIKIVDGKIVKFFQKRKNVARAINKDIVKVVAGIAVIVVVAMFIQMRVSKRDTKERYASIIPEYIDEKITYVEVGGRRMAADVSGEGEHTIVFLSPIAPTLTLQQMSSYLNDKYKVVLLDLFGTGFSDMTDKPRTTENVVEEIHAALHQLGINEPFVLVSHMYCGLYSLAYANTYPEDLEHVIEVDSFVLDEFKEELRANNLNKKAFYRINKHSAQNQLILQKILTKTGFIRFVWPVFEDFFAKENNKDILPIFEEMFKTCFYNEASYDRDIRNYENYFYTEGMKYPDNIPVLEMIGYATWHNNYYLGDWNELHQAQLSNNPKSKLIAFEGDIYSIFWNQRLFKHFIDEALEGIPEEK